MTEIKRKVASPAGIHRVRYINNVDPPSRFLLRSALLCWEIFQEIRRRKKRGKRKERRGRLGSALPRLRRVGRLFASLVTHKYSLIITVTH